MRLPKDYPIAEPDKASGNQCNRCKQVRSDVMVELCPRCIKVLVELRDSGHLQVMMPNLNLDELLDAEYNEYRRRHNK